MLARQLRHVERVRLPSSGLKSIPCVSAAVDRASVPVSAGFSVVSTPSFQVPTSRYFSTKAKTNDPHLHHPHTETQALDFAHKSELDVYAPKKHGHAKPDALKRQYHKEYVRSIQDPEGFWSEAAEKYIKWFAPFQKVHDGDFIDGDISWFHGGKLNACYNCVDQHLPDRADQVAIIWEGDEPGQSRHITYKQLSKQVNRIANVLKDNGVKKGDVVTVYMPMIPEVAMVMLACARIGAIHSVVFAGFSADSVRDRIIDGKSKFVVTANEGRRGGKSIKLKETVDAAVAQCPNVKNVFVFDHPHASAEGQQVKLVPNRDVSMKDALPKTRGYCPAEVMDSEDPLFLLYTSGSTGKPKGVAHSTAGYLVSAALSTDETFYLQEGDVYCCAADAGWITGHTYIVYGPLLNGATTVMFESVPTYPNPYRYWDMIERHKITQFYTAPTAIRALMKYDTPPIAKYDLSSLKILGSVGEPINPEAWKWFYEHVGHEHCTIVDTYWQTETGSHLATNLPGAVAMKPGSCAMPYYGVDLAILDPVTGKELEGNGVEGVLVVKKPFPSIARSIHGDHARFLSTYFQQYPGYYFTGDGARRDKDGYYWITGRVDDVINTSGHRIGTAEVESVLVGCKEVSEAAVIGFPHSVKGEGIGCYVILKEHEEPSDALIASLKKSVRQQIGSFATPDFIVFSDLPKTRSGKIMRRILRKVASKEEGSIGDVSTLADPTVVDKLIANFRKYSDK